MGSRRLFLGSDYEEGLDYRRLKNQVERIFFLMKDGKARTLSEIQKELETRYPGNHFPESSISAQLRNLRKPIGGSHTITKARRGNPMNGLFEYKLTIPPDLLKNAS